jgi:hypothetical protein
MSRRYADPVEVQRQDVDPAQFLWRGRLYLVRAVLARWTESGRWWRSAAATGITGGGEASAAPPGGAARAVDDGDREFWRVEAAAGRLAALGVYDLCFDWSRGAWFVVRALD